MIACDKLRNLRSLVADLEREGPATLARSNAPVELGWCVDGLVAAVQPRASRPIAQLERLATRFGELTRSRPEGKGADV